MHRLTLDEQRAYYPAAIILVDRPEVVDLFAASGALIQARVAVVDARGYPRHVLRWLVTGARAGHRAPVGYLHDEATVLYPFLFEPLATFVARDPAHPFRDLGFFQGRGFLDPVKKRRVHRLADATPSALVSFAVRGVIDMIEPDLVLSPRSTGGGRHPSVITSGYP